MTYEELLGTCAWTNELTATVEVESPALQRTVRVELNVPLVRQIPRSFVDVVNDFVAIPAGDVARLKDMLWSDARFCFEVTSYGVDVPAGMTEAEANARDFGVHDGEGAFAAAAIKYFSIDEQEFAARYGQLVLDCPWSGLVSAVVRNGRIIDLYETGVYLGWYEPGGKYADTPSYLRRGQSI